MSIIWKWNLDKFCLMVIKILLNEFDCFIVIEGNRGIGKSTLGYEILSKIHRYFRKIVSETGGKDSPYYQFYLFKPKKQLKNPKKYKYILYKRDDVINFFNKWHCSSLADEMINVTFNRDFYDPDQKNLIKVVNMNRDHHNSFIACVPRFQDLDVQVKNLCKIRLTIVRRGLCIIHTPNPSIYSRDKWDTAYNEKIERKWKERGTSRPQYSKLTTFRGIMKFPKLPEKTERLYQTIKNKERNIIKKELGITDDEEKDITDITVERLLKGRIRNMQVIEGIALANGLTLEQMRGRIRRKLEKMGANTSLTSYFWDKKSQIEADRDNKFKMLVDDLGDKL